jgi:hypothetical protein
MSISQIKRNAKKNLSGKWGLAIGLFLIMGLLIGITSFIFVGPIIIAGPLMLGFYTCYLKMQRNQDVEFEELFSGFNNFVTSMVTYLLIFIYTFLWSLLFIIPGIIKALSYSMSLFILADNPNMKANEAITKSKEMMNGHKWELFVLYLSFIGWMLLTILTFGILVIYVGPYMYASLAAFYEEIKGPSISVEEPNEFE